MRHAADEILQLRAFRPRQQRNASAFDGRVTDLHDFRGFDVGNEPDALG
jgi:hypothetical protein